RARLAVEGYYSGIHKSPYHGFNVEFAEYREYSPGDDLRYLDWRVLARSDRFFVKQFEAETNLSCYLLLDTSGSMDFTTASETRLDYGASLAAALALLMLRQGDQVGLVSFDNAVRHFIPPRGNARHFAAIVQALEGVKPGEDTDVSAVLHEIAERVRRRSLVVVISDFFDDVDRVLRGLQHFRHRRHEVIVLHLLDDAEAQFPYERVTLFEGMERGEEVVVDPRLLASAYRERFREFLDRLKRGCTEKSIDYERMWLSEPFDRALTAYLGRRK
ncbi:MAG: DUF58 domain-containing protein, partial [Candidatus Brocadiia bacterium]